MLRILPLADDLILPQARQEIYFFNRIGRQQTVAMNCTTTVRDKNWHKVAAIHQVNRVRPHPNRKFALKRLDGALKTSLYDT
jgi:hypothetical protein